MLNNDVSLKQLPVNFGDITNLNQIYAVKSGLEFLPSSFSNLKQLVIMYVIQVTIIFCTFKN